MASVSGTSRLPQVRRAAPGWAALVLAVLVGLLGMHALAPDGMPSAGEHTFTAAPHPARGHLAPSASSPAHGSFADRAPAARHHVHAGGPDAAAVGGEACHGSSTCAADGTSSAYAPPAPAADAFAATGAPAGAGGTVLLAGSGGRAPPDLAELQLLRV
ncbi:DUF6153 family protein [Streptomyces sp. NPDC059740]|uniref:DUF6153 family protein n=1 Tax=Streptomyces sp. NPDC059740 TaxID=3346926 RepID=UPI003660B424